MEQSKFLILLILAMICVGTVSCDLFELESRAYQGPTVVGFSFRSDQVEAAETDTAAYTIHLPVQLIRSKEGMLQEALSVTYIIIDSTTTAIVPDDYEILTPSPLTIPAGALKTSLNIKINGSNIPQGEARVLELQLTGNESRGVKGGVRIGHFELTIANTE